MKANFYDKLFTHWFWVFSAIFLIVFFISTGNSLIQSFYFVSFFLPVFILTSWYVTTILIPDFLIRKKYSIFILYAIYTLVISTYVHFLIIYLAIYLFTLFQMGADHIVTISISTLSLSMYILIFIKAFIHVFNILNQKELTINALEEQLNRNELTTIQVRFNRNNYTIKLEDIKYIESLSDYIKIHTLNDTITTKERIGHFNEQLPESFIRVHRSFVVNSSHVNSYNREFISLGALQLPISRTYKKDVFLKLQHL